LDSITSRKKSCQIVIAIPLLIRIKHNLAMGDKKQKAGLASGLCGDEVKYAFTQALRRAARLTWGRCPSRAASTTSMPTLNGQRNFQITIIQTWPPEKGSNFFKKNFRPPTLL
jgi:hypothetical protein